MVVAFRPGWPGGGGLTSEEAHARTQQCTAYHLKCLQQSPEFQTWLEKGVTTARHKGRWQKFWRGLCLIVVFILVFTAAGLAPRHRVSPQGSLHASVLPDLASFSKGAYAFLCFTNKLNKLPKLFIQQSYNHIYHASAPEPVSCLCMHAAGGQGAPSWHSLQHASDSHTC